MLSLAYTGTYIHIHTDGQTDRQTDRQTARQAGKQTGRHKQTDRRTSACAYEYVCPEVGSCECFHERIWSLLRSAVMVAESCHHIIHCILDQISSETKTKSKQQVATEPRPSNDESQPEALNLNCKRPSLRNAAICAEVG